MRILSGRLSPTEGKVTSMLKDGQDISMIFQDLQLANGASTLNNVLSGCLGRHSSFKTLLGFPKKEKETSIEWLRKFGLEKRLVNGHRPYPGGECQRLAICRSMLSSPTLLLADEPVASLDSDWANRTLRILKDSQKKGEAA